MEAVDLVNFDIFIFCHVYICLWFGVYITYIYSLSTCKNFSNFRVKIHQYFMAFCKKFCEIQVFCHLKHWKTLFPRTLKSLKEFPVLNHGADGLTHQLCCVLQGHMRDMVVQKHYYISNNEHTWNWFPLFWKVYLTGIADVLVWHHLNSDTDREKVFHLVPCVYLEGQLAFIVPLLAFFLPFLHR